MMDRDAKVFCEDKPQTLEVHSVGVTAPTVGVDKKTYSYRRIRLFHVAVDVGSHVRPLKMASYIVVHLSCSRMSKSDSAVAIVEYILAENFRQDSL